MFGLRRKATDVDQYVIAIRAAMLVRAYEIEHAKLADTAIIRKMIRLGIRERNVNLSTEGKELIEMGVQALLSESDFVNEIVERLMETENKFEIDQSDIEKAQEAIEGAVDDFLMQRRT